MGNRSDCYGRGTALEGDKTTPCPKCGEAEVIVSGEPRDTNNGKMVEK